MAALRSSDSSPCVISPGRSSRALTVSETDMDLALALVHLDGPQAGRWIGWVLAGADVVLVSVPGADDVQLLGEVVAEAPLALVEPLDDAVHERALADRAAE